MRRRDFMKGIVGSATAWPLMARAQQGEHMRRIGVLMSIGADDPEASALVEAFSQGLAEAGWIIGRNARIEPERGVLHIPIVERAFFFGADKIAAVDLRPTGDPGADHQAQRVLPQAFLRCPLLAQRGHSTVAWQCPLLGIKRTWRFQSVMSAFDPKRTSTARD